MSYDADVSDGVISPWNIRSGSTRISSTLHLKEVVMPHYRFISIAALVIVPSILSAQPLTGEGTGGGGDLVAGRKIYAGRDFTGRSRTKELERDKS